MTRPLILVSNDDGYRARGIEVLAAVASEFGDVIVCAPSDERSGTSHAITLHSSLRSDPIREGWWAVTGTPVDCVYLGALHLCPRLPDLVLAGVNHGYNLGGDVFYSGTVGAAREGRLRGASAAAFSVAGGIDPTEAESAIRRIVPALLSRHQAGERHLLNVNVPAGGAEGDLRVVRLGARRYRETVERREDLQGREYFWIGGPPEPNEGSVEEDTHVVSQGDVAVTALSLDHTADDWQAWRDHL